MKIFDKMRHLKKRGFIGVEYVLVTAIILVGSVGIYINSQNTIKNTQKEGSAIMSDEDANLITSTGTSGGALVSKITITPSDIYIPSVGDTASATVTLQPDTSWRVGLKWEGFFNTGYTQLTEENSGYKVTVKGLTKGVSKYKLTTTDGSTASAQLSVQVGRPSDFLITPETSAIDEDQSITLRVNNSDDYWDNISVESWTLMSGEDLVSIAPSEDKRTAVVTADGPDNGGTVSVKVTVNDQNFGAKYDVYANITVNKDYFTTFDVNNGNGSYTTLKAAATRTVQIPENYMPTRTGYTFLGWKLSYGSTIYQPGETYKMPEQDNTMTAQWNAVNYPVVFDLNYDGKLHSQLELAYESKLGTLPSPSRNGYTFLGWFTEPTNGTEVTSETTVPLNGATYYAHWSANDYTITYDMNGAKETFGSVTAPCDSVIQLNETVPTKDYYTFTGWTSSFDGKTYGAGSKFTIPYQNATLKAEWKTVEYSVTYVTNGGTFSTTPASTYTTETGITLPTSSTISRTGYTFAGWYTTSDFTGSQVTSIAENTGGNLTFYAKWTANSYTLSYNANGGSVSTSSKTVYYGSKIGTMATPSRTGYTFAGWYTSASGGSRWTADTTYTTTENSTVYAHWTANQYTITFNANGGSVSPASETVTYGASIGTLPTPSRTYYTFAGWYTAASGGTQWSSNQTYTTAESITLYAHWTPSFAAVNVYNNITGVGTTYNISYGSSKDVGSLSASGYTFKSYTSLNTSIATVSGTTIKAVGASAVTIYSNWYAATPWIVSGYGNYSGWSSSSRRLVYTNGGANMSGFINNRGTSKTYPSYSNALEYPSGWTAGYTDGYHSNSGYIAFKMCASGTNYDGTNRCGSSNITWIGADTNAPTGSMSTSSTGNGYNLNHYWASKTSGVSGAKIAKVDTSVNFIGSGCLSPYDGRITTQMTISYPTPGGSWVWASTFRVTAYKNGDDGNYSWINGSSILTKDIESYAYSGCGNGCGIWQRMIPYEQTGKSAASHTNWC